MRLRRTKSAGRGPFTAQHRALTAAVVALVTFQLHQVGASLEGYRGDFDQVWHASRAVLRGVDPYSVVGPGLEYSMGFPLYYPMPALVAALPLALLPLALARSLFVTLSAGLLAWGITREGPGRLWIFASGAFLGAVAGTQWSPLLTAALLVPLLAPLTVVKPNLAVAFGAAGPERRYYVAAIAGGSLLVGASFLLDPGWIAAWLSALRGAPHFTPPILLPGGFLVLAALFRWRRAEARLIVAMACIPHTTLPYETLPLLLVPRGWKEGATLATLSFVHFVLQFPLDVRLPTGDPGAMAAFADWTRTMGSLGVALVYLPATLMVLRRRNVWVGFHEAGRDGRPTVNP